MANISEMSGLKQWGALLAGVALITGALYFTIFKSQREANATAQTPRGCRNGLTAAR